MDIPTFGWSLEVIPGLGLHLVPINDTHLHLDEGCPCQPVLVNKEIDDVEVQWWEHNSYDGREAFEDGERKPS